MNRGVLKICCILFMVFLIFSCFSVTCFAEEESSTVPVSDSVTDYTSISSLQSLSPSDILIFICFILSIGCGLLIGQAFSFWKW